MSDQKFPLLKMVLEILPEFLSLLVVKYYFIIMHGRFIMPLKNFYYWFSYCYCDFISLTRSCFCFLNFC